MPPETQRTGPTKETGPDLLGSGVKVENTANLSIPASIPDDLAGAALAYAAAGWYVGPLKPKSKHPGSILGKGWPAKTSRDREVIVGWFAGTSAGGLFLHVGRSGAVAIDVDVPEKLPVELAVLLYLDDDVPWQGTRDEDGSMRDTGSMRGHFLFCKPAGRAISNSVKGFDGDWGDIRGDGGVIVVYPTEHEKADDGGRYSWLRTGTLPEAPTWLAERLDNAYEHDSAVSDQEVRRWIDEHRTGTEPARLMGILKQYRERTATGSRHPAMVACLVWGAKEVNAGLIAAPALVAELTAAHHEALARADHPNKARKPGNAVASALAWAIPQAALTPLVDTWGTTVGKASQNGSAPTAPRSTSVANATDVDLDPEGHDRDSWDAVELLGHSFPHVEWPVPELYPPGLTILSGPPKQGKSLLILRACVCVATGQPFLDQPTARGAVMYCALEDGARRAQRRLKLMPGHELLRPEDLTIRVVAPRVDEGLLELLDEWADSRPPESPARVIVLDVFQRVRSVATSQGKNAYGDDYAAMSPLQKWANQRSICLVVLHHNRKATSDDAFDSVSGTTGMTGAVDMVQVLRGGRGEKEAGLFVAGRDTIEDRNYSLILENGIWRPGPMPVELATASGRQKFARFTWKLLHGQGFGGATTEQVAELRKSTADSAAKHLAGLEEQGWAQALNASGPGHPVRWRAVTDDGWPDPVEPVRKPPTTAWSQERQTVDVELPDPADDPSAE